MEISPARLAVVPTTTFCTTCQQIQGDVPRVRGFMSWEHKTAPEIIIGPDADKLRQYDRRGFHAQLPLNSKENPRLRAYVQNCNVSDAVRETPRNPEVEMTPVLRNAARCHPDRKRINVKGDCLECALEKQARRDAVNDEERNHRLAGQGS